MRQVAEAETRRRGEGANGKDSSRQITSLIISYQSLATIWVRFAMAIRRWPQIIADTNRYQNLSRKNTSLLVPYQPLPTDWVRFAMGPTVIMTRTSSFIIHRSSFIVRLDWVRFAMGQSGSESVSASESKLLKPRRSAFTEATADKHSLPRHSFSDGGTGTTRI